MLPYKAAYLGRNVGEYRRRQQHDNESEQARSESSYANSNPRIVPVLLAKRSVSMPSRCSMLT